MKLFAVADGMGGHKGGEVASRVAVETLASQMQSMKRSATTLVDAVHKASARIHDLAQIDATLESMGTTTSAVWIDDNVAHIAHVGDSRVYLIRKNTITRLTDDHSLVAEQVRAGYLTEEQAKHSPYKNVISRAVGVHADVEVDHRTIALMNSDVLVLCSDGLTGLVSDVEIHRTVTENFVFRAPKALVDLANSRGGHDNITAVVAWVVDDKEVRPWCEPKTT